MTIAYLIACKVALLTGHVFTPTEVIKALENAGKEFTTPDVVCLMSDPEDEESTDGAGWYWRLSASGFLDCTEWSGPFYSEPEAIADMLQTYGDEWLTTQEDLSHAYTRIHIPH